jgi:hypothetical protein
VSAVVYLRQALWPADLAVFYPHPASVGEGVPAWQWGGALLLLAAISAGAVLLRDRRPWLLAGWLWYLLTLAPVLGIVQNWEQARADRFTYLPLVGPFIAFSWEAAALARRRPRLRIGIAAGAAAVVVGLALAAREQAAVWRDPETLFRRALAVTERNWLAAAQLGVVLAREGRFGEAEARLREALALRTPYPLAHNNLGTVLARTGRDGEAAREYEEAVREDPRFPEALVNLGTARMRAGRVAEAAALYARALEVDPENEAARYDLELARRALAAGAGRPPSP